MFVALAGILACVLMFVPFLFMNKSLKVLSNVSFSVSLLLLWPHFIFNKMTFSIGEKKIKWEELFSLSESLSLATFALLPLAIKSTMLLHRNEIRTYIYVRNISLFLFVSLFDNFFSVIFFIKKFINYLFSH